MQRMRLFFSFCLAGRSPNLRDKLQQSSFFFPTRVPPRSSRTKEFTHEWWRLKQKRLRAHTIPRRRRYNIYFILSSSASAYKKRKSWSRPHQKNANKKDEKKKIIKSWFQDFHFHSGRARVQRRHYLKCIKRCSHQVPRNEQGREGTIETDRYIKEWRGEKKKSKRERDRRRSTKENIHTK